MDGDSSLDLYLNLLANLLSEYISLVGFLFAVLELWSVLKAEPYKLDASFHGDGSEDSCANK